MLTLVILFQSDETGWGCLVCICISSCNAYFSVGQHAALQRTCVGMEPCKGDKILLKRKSINRQLFLWRLLPHPFRHLRLSET